MQYLATITKEGDSLLAEFPDAPGCQTFARTEAELREAAREALEGWLEAHLIDGEAPPRPKRRRATAGHWLVDVDPALSVALQLRWARQDAGLTQTELARRVGVSQQQIGKLERNGTNPSLVTLEKLARALGARLEVKLLEAAEPPAVERHRAVERREAPPPARGRSRAS
ncbi:type II toxin-antitoxin system HicB family antitoxin [Polyangium aurulentum]|uniref:type II toxin-antitoxin system HicB family antitoxin n=1 Tax=Polyangium aurulentum TaxID=2567896 RepID=UPI0010AE7C6E|nr:type II toxin-antitoxin system HicB family antitoxin [Polyangium aurulentum]UQA56324.1 type II toxin-antitoxin system HicB family antitoxin [Polyangium aurulentum]